jgi:hypothetical protein
VLRHTFKCALSLDLSRTFSAAGIGCSKETQWRVLNKEPTLLPSLENHGFVKNLNFEQWLPPGCLDVLEKLAQVAEGIPKGFGISGYLRIF